MSIEKWNKNTSDATEAPMVFVDEDGQEITLNSAAKEISASLSEQERSEIIAGKVSSYLKGILAAAGLTAIASTAPAVLERYHNLDKSKTSSSAPETTSQDGNDQAEILQPTETKEVLRPESKPAWLETIGARSEYVDGYTATMQMSVDLHADQVLFADHEGQLLVDKPITITGAAGYTPEEMTVSYNQAGPVGIPRAWSMPQKELIASEYNISASDVEMIHVYRALAQAQDVEANTLTEVVEKRLSLIEQSEGLDFETMLATNFTFTIDTPDQSQIASGLYRLIPGLIAQESLYKTTVVSRAGAKGPMQIMPDTWKSFADSGMDIHSLSDSLVVASRYFEASYNYLTQNLETELSEIETRFFDGDHAAFVEHFLLPLLINGYNAGDGNMRKVIEWFYARYPDKETLEHEFGRGSLQNKDIYFAMAQLARDLEATPNYGPHASWYAFHIFGWSNALARP